MNKNIDDGGPAFPMGYHPEGSNNDHFGMTIRDVFAAAALKGICSCVDDRTHSSSEVLTLEEWRLKIALDDARYCYRMADAMIKVSKE